MTATTTQLAAPAIRRPRTVLVGTMFASGAALMTYFGVLAVYVSERADARDAGEEWFPEGVIELGPSGWIFWTLVLAAFTVQWAVQAIRNDDRPNAYIALALTGMFGAAVFNQLWFIINDTGFALAGTQGQFLFFVMTGTYIVFLIGAVVFLALTTMRALFGQFGPSRTTASPLLPCSGMRSPSCTGSPGSPSSSPSRDQMFTTGFKFFFGLTIALTIGAVAYGYSTGGEHVGPVTLGWKGGVGDHVGYLVLIGGAFASACFAGIIVAFRDADPAAQSHYMGVEAIAPTTPVTGSFWPVIGAFGGAAMVLGLVLGSAVFVLGLVICSLVAIEWTMDAWADRATGDAEANKALRDRIMAPFEIPVAGALGVAVMALAASRIFLNATKLGAVVWAGLIAVTIFGLGILYAARPKMNKNVIAGLVLAVGVAVIAGGIVTAVDGQRDFEHHSEHHGDDHGEEHGEDHSEEGEASE